MNGLREAKKNEKLCFGEKVKKIWKKLKGFEISQCQMKKTNLKSHFKVTTTGFTTDCKTDF